MPPITFNWQSSAAFFTLVILWIPTGLIPSIVIVSLIPQRRTILRHIVAWLTPIPFMVIAGYYFYSNWSALWATKMSSHAVPSAFSSLLLCLYIHYMLIRQMLTVDDSTGSSPPSA